MTPKSTISSQTSTLSKLLWFQRLLGSAETQPVTVKSQTTNGSCEKGLQMMQKTGIFECFSIFVSY